MVPLWVCQFATKHLSVSYHYPSLIKAKAQGERLDFRVRCYRIALAAWRSRFLNPQRKDFLCHPFAFPISMINVWFPFSVLSAIWSSIPCGLHDSSNGQLEVLCEYGVSRLWKFKKSLSLISKLLKITIYYLNDVCLRMIYKQINAIIWRKQVRVGRLIFHMMPFLCCASPSLFS